MYVARTPHKTALHNIVRENYRQVFFNKEIQGSHLPFHLEREFRKYLTCGFLEFGMALIPPPRQNLIRYFGVFGARHKKKSVITAMAQPKKVKIKKMVYRTPWAELLKYVFKYEVNYCDHCATKLKLVACISSRYECYKILKHLEIPIYEVSAIAPRAPPQNSTILIRFMRKLNT